MFLVLQEFVAIYKREQVMAKKAKLGLGFASFLLDWLRQGIW